MDEKEQLGIKRREKRRRVDVACSFEWVFLLCNHFTPFPLIIAVIQYAHILGKYVKMVAVVVIEKRIKGWVSWLVHSLLWSVVIVFVFGVLDKSFENVKVFFLCFLWISFNPLKIQRTFINYYYLLFVCKEEEVNPHEVDMMGWRLYAFKRKPDRFVWWLRWWWRLFKACCLIIIIIIHTISITTSST